MAEFIEGLSKDAKKEIQEFVNIINTGVKSVNDMNAAFKQTKVPSAINKQIKEVNNETKKQLKQTSSQIRLSKKLEREEKKRQRQRIAELKLQKQRERAFDKYDRQLAREEKRLQRSQGLYNQVQARVNKLTLEYNNLAARKELNGKLTRQEAKDLDYLEMQLNKYQGVLKKVDSNIGKYQRNVGNYASGWNGLSNSINQLTREAPAFANSMQTGFMALSNNIPILVDEINRLKIANQQLQAQGKPTTSVLRQIGKSLLSWQTAISLGVTLLTIYGAELVDLVGSFFSTSNAIDKANDALDEYNEKLNETRGSNQSEIITLKELIKVAGDETETREKRNQAVQILQDKYPKYLSNLTTENTKNIEIAESINKITQSLQNKAKLQAAESIIQEKANKMYEEQISIQDDYLDRVKLINEGIKSTLGINVDIADSTTLDSLTKDQLIAIRDNFGAAISDAKAQRQTAIMETEDDFANYSKFIKQIISDTPDLFDLFNPSTGGNEQSNFDELKKGTISYFEEIITRLKEQQTDVATTRKEYQGFQKQIEDAEAALLKLKREFMGFTDQTPVSALQSSLEPIKTEFELIVKGIEDTSEKMANLSTQMKADLAGAFAEIGAMYGLNMNRFQQLFDDKENTVKDYAIAAFDTLGALSNLSTQNEIANINAQLEANRRYYENQIQLAQGNENQQQILRQQQEAKERELLTKRAKAERKQAIFETIVSTAVAVTKALPNIPLSILVGALGAAKTAMIKAQPLPQYKKGRKGGKEEYAILGDGYKNEPILDKKGNLKGISPDKPTLMHLDKGDTVLPSLDQLNNAAIMASVHGNQKSLENENMTDIFAKMLSNQKKDIIKSLKQAKFVNNNYTNVDLNRAFRHAKYK